MRLIGTYSFQNVILIEAKSTSPTLRCNILDLRKLGTKGRFVDNFEGGNRISGYRPD